MPLDMLARRVGVLRLVTGSRQLAVGPNNCSGNGADSHREKRRGVRGWRSDSGAEHRRGGALKKVRAILPRTETPPNQTAGSRGPRPCLSSVASIGRGTGPKELTPLLHALPVGSFLDCDRRLGSDVPPGNK
jgi:hypothetical protein